MTVYNIIQEVFFCLFDVIIPERLTWGHEGFNINIGVVDPFNLLSTDPSSPEGRYLYESNDPQKCMNALIYTALQTNADAPAVYQKNGKELLYMYYAGGNYVRAFIGPDYANQKLSSWAEDYMLGLSFYNLPNFIAELVDIITGVVSVKTNKSTESFEQNAKIMKVLTKLFGFCQTNDDNQEQNLGDTGQILEPIVVSPTNYLQDQEDKKNNNNNGKLFDFSPDEILNIEDIARLRSQGKVRFSTCGNFEVAINPDDALNKMDELFADKITDAVTEYTDPDTGDKTNVAVYDNSIVIPDISNTAAFLDNILTDNLVNYEDSNAGNEQGTPSGNEINVNLPNMKVEFELSIFKAIPYALAQFIISPQLLVLIKTASVVIGDEENAQTFTLDNIFDKLWKIISEIGQQIWNALLNSIFGILIKELTGILTDLATKYLSQQATNYLSVLQFLINLIKGLNLKASGCQSMLDIIMQLLSLNYFGPQLPVPPPLIYAGGMLKPGMNEVSAVNNLKSTLSSKGLEVGAYMADGTPNYGMMIAEETLKTAIAEVRNSSVQVFTMGTTGPAMGYAQII